MGTQRDDACRSKLIGRGKAGLIRRTTITLLLFVLCLPAHAHSTHEIETWLEDWRARIPADGMTLDDPLLHELTEFIARHPEHFDPQPVSRSVPNDSKSARVHRGMGSNVEQWRGLVEQYFPADQVDTALRVMACESGGNPNAKNPRSSARGLFQILGSLWAPHFGVSLDDLYDPTTNTRLAAQILSLQGWNAWTCH